MTTELFVYGTLRHDQPEHARFCRGVTAWRPARVRGRLWRLPSGYLLLVVPAEDVFLRATNSPDEDERRRSRLRRSEIALPSAHDVWVEGEILTFADAAVAWPPIDAWEDFTPGCATAYQRTVVRADGCGAPGDPAVHAWAYVAVEPPPGASPL